MDDSIRQIYEGIIGAQTNLMDDVSYITNMENRDFGSTVIQLHELLFYLLSGSDVSG